MNSATFLNRVRSCSVATVQAKERGHEYIIRKNAKCFTDVITSITHRAAGLRVSVVPVRVGRLHAVEGGVRLVGGDRQGADLGHLVGALLQEDGALRLVRRGLRRDGNGRKTIKNPFLYFLTTKTWTTEQKNCI